MIFTFEKLEDNNEQQHTFVATDDDTNTNYEIKFTLVSFHFLYNIPEHIFQSNQFIPNNPLGIQVVNLINRKNITSKYSEISLEHNIK